MQNGSLGACCEIALTVDATEPHRWEVNIGSGNCLSPLGYDTLWWRHQMETFSVLLAFCAGNSPVTGEFPSQRPVTRSFDVVVDLSLE